MTTPADPQQAVAALYDASAAVYEQLWAPVLNRHARDLLRAVERPAGTSWTALDVAAGTGTLAPALRELVGPDGLVIAADRSMGMLRRAPGALARVQADAGRLPVADGSADVVVLAFVLFLLPDARLAVAEAARVLRPGGQLLAATWGSQDGTVADTVVREELDAAGAPPVPAMPRSDELTDTPERMARLLTSGGFTNIRTSARPLDARFDAESSVTLRLGAGNLGWRYTRLERAAQQRVRGRVQTRLAPLPPEAFVDQSEVLLTTARLG